MGSMVADVTAVWWMTLAIIGEFSGFAVILSAIGLYGLLAWFVEERTHELGIRIALGATSQHIGRLILANAVWLVVYGLGIGIAAALAVGPLVRHLMFEVSPADPAAVAAATCLLLSVALAATYLPARRARRVDPIEALRAE